MIVKECDIISKNVHILAFRLVAIGELCVELITFTTTHEKKEVYNTICLTSL